MTEKKILKTETVKKLILLKKHHYRLPHSDFLCDGAIHVWKLQIKIIEKLLERFNKYTHKQLQLINTVLPFLEKICGYLDDSKTINVPWSIIPSLEDLFSKVKPDTQFVICPLWENNYQIINRNIVEYLDNSVISIPGLLFDPGSNFEAEKKNFLSDAPSGIYFVFYPRSERLSVLHFPLLGHEIGHIFASSWLDSNFNDSLFNQEAEKTLKAEIDSEIPPDVIDPIFKETFINNRLLEMLEIFHKVLSEVISDIVGVFIFGPSALLSSFIFAIKFGLDDFRALEYGYLSWRFRLFFICKAIKYMENDKLPSRYTKSIQLMEEILTLADIDINKYSYNKQHRFIRHIVRLFDEKIQVVFQDIESFLADQVYSKNYDESHQKKIFERLQNGIIPNSILDDKLDETPMGLRNIVGSTWLFVNELSESDSLEYFKKASCANLLSIKAIELSHFQKDFDKKKYISNNI